MERTSSWSSTRKTTRISLSVSSVKSPLTTAGSASWWESWQATSRGQCWGWILLQTQSSVPNQKLPLKSLRCQSWASSLLFHCINWDTRATFFPCGFGTCFLATTLCLPLLPSPSVCVRARASGDKSHWRCVLSVLQRLLNASYGQTLNT